MNKAIPSKEFRIPAVKKTKVPDKKNNISDTYVMYIESYIS